MSTYSEHADLYDVAFSWDVGEEVDWLLERLGRDVRTVLEPACGSLRMGPAFAARGVELAGIEREPTMVQRAVRRMQGLGLPTPRIHFTDMADFALGEFFDGAICPINSLAHLPAEAGPRHLDCLGRHLRSGAGYLVQLDLTDYARPCEQENAAQWESEAGGERVRTHWYARSFDAATRVGVEVCRFEVLSGPRAGLVVEDEHHMQRWSWADWSALIAASPFALAAAYDGMSSARGALPCDRSLERRSLTWFELRRR